MAGATDPRPVLRGDPACSASASRAAVPRSGSWRWARRSSSRAARRCSGSTGCRTPTTRTASRARSARWVAVSAGSGAEGGEAHVAAGHPSVHVVPERGREPHRRHADRRPRRDDDVRRHADLVARARVLARVHARRPPLHALLRGVELVHRVDVVARRRQQHPADARRLGAGGSLLLHAHRSLVGGEAQLRRRAQGVPHHAYRRHRSAHRRDHDLLRRAERHRSRHLQHPRRQHVGGELQGQPHVVVVDRARVAAGDHRQVGPVPVAHVAPRRDGRPDPGVGAHPRGHDGGRGRVPRRPPLPGLLVRALDRHAGPRRTERDGRDRWHHGAHRRRARVRPRRHQEGAGVLHDQPARLHGDGARCGRVDRGRVPPLHARVLQGRPLPRLGIGRATPDRTTPST